MPEGGRILRTRSRERSPEPESEAGVRSSESGDSDEYWTDCFDYIYVNVQYAMWPKYMLW